MGLALLLGEEGKAHDRNCYFQKIDKYVLPTRGKGIGPSFTWVGAGLLSRGEGWPFSGLKLGLALPSWGRGWPASCGYNHNLKKNHTMMIISDGGGK